MILIAGPAKQLLRVRSQAATVKRTRGIFPHKGDASGVEVMFSLPETGTRLTIVFDRAAWDDLAARVQSALVFE